jgi:hypothetical protein
MEEEGADTDVYPKKKKKSIPRNGSKFSARKLK